MVCLGLGDIKMRTCDSAFSKRKCEWRGCKSLCDVHVVRVYEGRRLDLYYCKGHYDALVAHKAFEGTDYEVEDES